MKKNKTAPIVKYFFAYLFAFIFLYPIYFTVISSVKDNNEIWNTMFALPSVMQWSNYTTAIQDVGILQAVVNSLIFAIGASIVVVIFITMAAYVGARKLMHGSGFMKLYFLLGLMIPPYAMLVPVVTMFTQYGLTGQYWSMIFLYAAINFPLSYYLISNFISTVSRELDEAATIDGCGTLGIVFKIIFPIAMPGISTAAILTFLSVYNEFVFANSLLTTKTMKTIAVRLMGLSGERFTSYGPMFASIVMSIIPILIVYLLLQERVESGMTAGAVKG
ncbi:MAG: carbohydrate ABC transporter permease [Clostridia bacterium]